MKTKKLLSMLLVAGMALTMLAGCGGNAENPGGSTPQPPSTQTTPDTPEDTGAPEDEVLEPSEITVVLRTLGPVDESGSAAVEEAVNAITQEKLNMTVDLMWVDSATYATQVPMMITGNEKMDLFMYTPNPSTTYATLMAQNQLMDITELLDKYGKNVTDTLGSDLLAATSREGKVYGVGNYGPLTFKPIIAIRRDLCEEAGVVEQAENAQSLDDVEAVLEAVVAKTGLGLVNADVNGSTTMCNPALLAGNSFADAYVYDNLGDSANMFMANKATGKVECMYFDDDVKAVLKRTYDWYHKGLIYSDAATATDFGAVQIKNNLGSALITTTETGAEAGTLAGTGYDMIALSPMDTSKSMITTGNLTKFGFAVPVTAIDPDSAIRFLNLLYDKESGLGDLLSWGIEGRDYVVENGFATYPEGVSAENVQYHIADFLYGSRINITPWAGSMENVRQMQEEANKNAAVSDYLGFSINNADLEETLTACIQVFEQYKGTILSGSASGDFEAYYKEFQDALVGAGVNDLVAAYQEQLDAWLAANK